MSVTTSWRAVVTAEISGIVRTNRRSTAARSGRMPASECHGRLYQRALLYLGHGAAKLAEGEGHDVADGRKMRRCALLRCGMRRERDRWREK